ncbi:MAG: hypothetical protein HZB76_06175 [Chlamydiae bacterium]|nr:hypothetical protein [Chlamydiota bacterium]
MPTTHAQANQAIINSIVNNGVGGSSVQDIINEYKSSYVIIQMIMIKIQTLSNELQSSYILANQDLSNVDQDLNDIKNDINNILKSGSNPDLAAKLAQDISKYNADVGKYETDKATYGSTYPAAWNSISDADLANLKNMFMNQQNTGNDSNTYPTVGDLINGILKGDPTATADFNTLLNAWYKVHNGQPDGSASGDILYQWLNGGDKTTPTSYGSNAVVTELDGANGQNTDQINKFGTIIQTEYQAAQGVLGQLQALGNAIMQNQQQGTQG